MSVTINGTNGLVFNDNSTQNTSPFTGGFGDNFQPTALLVMTHAVTSMQYFCKTTRLDELNYYKGSGTYWKRHLKKHGRNVKVGVLGIYFDKNRCIESAIKFSFENDIVNSDNWANLIAENGLDGSPSGENHPMYGKQSPCIGQKRPYAGKIGSENPMYGKPSPMRGKSNIGASLALKGRPRPKGGGKPARPVVCLDTGIEFNSVASAAKSVNGSGSDISACCLGKSKTAYGKRWAYKEAVCL
jgi:hypothetical protein